MHIYTDSFHTHMNIITPSHLHIHVDMDTMSEASKSTDISAQIFKHRQTEKRKTPCTQRKTPIYKDAAQSHTYLHIHRPAMTHTNQYTYRKTRARIHTSRGCKYPLPAVAQNSPPLVWECHIRHNRICCLRVPGCQLPGHRACPGAGLGPGV